MRAHVGQDDPDPEAKLIDGFPQLLLAMRIRIVDKDFLDANIREKTAKFAQRWAKLPLVAGAKDEVIAPLTESAC